MTTDKALMAAAGLKEPPKKRIKIGLAPVDPNAPPIDDGGVGEFLRWNDAQRQKDAPKPVHPDVIPPVDQTKPPTVYRGMEFFPEDDMALREMYARVYGKEGAEKRIAQAQERYAKRPEVDELASMINYSSQEKTPVFRAPVDLHNMEAETSTLHDPITSERMAPSTAKVYMAKNAGSSTKLHELAHANQRFGSRPYAGVMHPDFQKVQDAEAKKVVNDGEIAPWIAGLKVKYYQETGTDLYPNSPKEDYAKFLDWMEGAAKTTPRMGTLIEGIHKFLTNPPPAKKDLVDEMLRQIAYRNPETSGGSRA
jgi:hypothetical protein